MPRFEVPLIILVDADNEEAAFSDVRTNYCVVNDPQGAVKENIVDMHVGEVTQVEADADIEDYG